MLKINSSGIYSCFALIILTASCLLSFPVTALQFYYCYENSELLPHFSGNSSEVPAKSPGAAIEILQQIDELTSDIEFVFVRYPWKRCLRELEAGKVHGIVGSYTPKRSDYAVFPKKNNTVDTSKAFSEASTCLIHKTSKLIIWNNDVFEFTPPITMSIPSGYRSINALKKYGFSVYETNSASKAHELLFNGRVDASISSCDIDNLPKYIALNPKPIGIQYGYLIISKHFYRLYPDHSETMWDILKTIDKNHYYSKYQ